MNDEKVDFSEDLDWEEFEDADDLEELEKNKRRATKARRVSKTLADETSKPDSKKRDHGSNSRDKRQF